MHSRSVNADSSPVRIEQVGVERALERSGRSCAAHMAAVATVSGCCFDCLFCPHTRHHLRPDAIQMRVELPSVLERELAKRRRFDRKPKAVLVNPNSDPFMPLGPVLALTYEVMRVLLEHDVAVHFRTRGEVPQGFGELFGKHAGKLRSEVALFSMDAHLAAIHEPLAPEPQKRLETIRRLKNWGVAVRARIEPLIPFISDTAGHLEELVRHLRSAGVEQASASYLVLRPKVLERLADALPTAHFHLIKGSFKNQRWRELSAGRTAKLLPERTRIQGYERLASIARRSGLQLSICACQDPTRGESCYAPDRPTPQAGSGRKAEQLELFREA